MWTHLRPAAVLLLGLTLITGVLYPLGMTGLAQLAFPRQANGSLLERDGKVIGSALIGQNFIGEGYFHGRPSATSDADPADATKTVSSPYNAAASSGSNLGPTSKALMDRIKDDAVKLQSENSASIPVDLVTSSASGLDPDITPAAAEFQVRRVAVARGMPEDALRLIVAANTEARFMGVLGEPRVNVLALNLAVDAAQVHKSGK